MIETNVVLEILDSKKEKDLFLIQLAQANILEIFEKFYDDELLFLIENRAILEPGMTEAEVT